MRWLQGLTLVAVALLGALVVLEGVVIRNLQRRVAALEAEPPMLGAAGGATARGPGRPEAAGGTDEEARTARREAFDAALKERIAAVLTEAEQKREDERGARFQEALDAQLEEWAAAEGVDAATLARVQDELQRRGELFRTLRQEIRDGTLTFADARDEIEANREESDAALQKILGPDRFTSLQDEVLSRMGPPGPGGPEGRPPPP